MVQIHLGSFLYLVKLSRPDLANSVRELSKAMDGAAPVHVKELKRLVQFLEKTKVKGLKMKFSQEELWEIQAYSNSDYAGDKEGRKSVTGMIIFVCGVPNTWKGQQTVAISRTEAVYIALSKTVREVKFISQVLEALHIGYKKPVPVYVDNMGAIFLAKSRNSSKRTKHIDIKYHYVRSQIDLGLTDIIFVKSEENVADIFTKNLKAEIFESHEAKIISNG